MKIFFHSSINTSSQLHFSIGGITLVFSKKVITESITISQFTFPLFTDIFAIVIGVIESLFAACSICIVKAFTFTKVIF